MANTNKTPTASPSPPKRKDVILRSDAPPRNGAPSTPVGWKKPAQNPRYGAPPTTQQQRDAGDVAREVQAATYRADFGDRAPDPTTLSDALTRAQSWTEERDAAVNWIAYTHDQYAKSWADVDALMKKLSGPYQIASDDDATILKRYRQTGAFLNVRKVAGKKAAVTKRRKKKAAAKKG